MIILMTQRFSALVKGACYRVITETGTGLRNSLLIQLEIPLKKSAGRKAEAV